MREDTRSDKEIVASCQAGNRQDFDILIGRYSGKLYQIAYGMLGNEQDAEEVVQDAFVRAYRAMPVFLPGSTASYRIWPRTVITGIGGAVLRSMSVCTSRSAGMMIQTRNMRY